MKRVGTEKMLRVYVAVSTALLVVVLASSIYMYGKISQLEKNQKVEMSALGAIANGVSQTCNCGVDY